MNISEWTQLLDSNWDDLIVMIGRYHPASEQPTLEAPRPITAPGAERACQETREEIREKGGSPIDAARLAKKEGDHETLWSLLQQTWFGLPESESVHSIPGFGVLCDLCSEYEGPW